MSLACPGRRHPCAMGDFDMHWLMWWWCWTAAAGATVTGIARSNKDAAKETGQYFMFRKADFIAVFGAFQSGSTQALKQCRAGALQWEGTVKYWDNAGGVYGRRNSGQAAKQWAAGDVMVPKGYYCPGNPDGHRQVIKFSFDDKATLTVRDENDHAVVWLNRFHCVNKEENKAKFWRIENAVTSNVAPKVGEAILYVPPRGGLPRTGLLRSSLLRGGWRPAAVNV